MNGIIYQIRNLINGKSYIGLTIRKFAKRKAHHIHLLRAGEYSDQIKHGNQHLQRAWNLYGEENFVFEIIHKFENITQEELDLIEIKCIASIPKDMRYNVDEGGKAPKNRVISEETKAKISKSNTGKVRSEETKKLISESKKGQRLGIKRTEESRRKASRTLKGRIFTQEWKDNLSKANLGKQASEETKQLMSETHKGLQAGEKHGGAKLTEAQVREIKFELVATMTRKEIAELYGVTASAVTQILTNNRWKHITKEHVTIS